MGRVRLERKQYTYDVGRPWKVAAGILLVLAPIFILHSTGWGREIDAFLGLPEAGLQGDAAVRAGIPSHRESGRAVLRPAPSPGSGRRSHARRRFARVQPVVRSRSSCGRVARL